MTLRQGREAAAARHGYLRASHADREHVIDVLKAAFVQGRLTRDELDVRVARTLASRTYADLTALTADLPAGLLPPRRPARAPAADRPARPTVSIAAKLGACLAVGPAVLVGAYFTSNDLLAKWLFVFDIVYYLALMVAGVALLDSWHRKHSGEQPPPRPTRRGRPLEAGPNGTRGGDLARSELRGKARPHHPPGRAGCSRRMPAVHRDGRWPANLEVPA